MIRYHITAKRYIGGHVSVEERGLGSFLYSTETRKNLRAVAENIARQTSHTVVLVRPTGEDSLPEVYTRFALKESLVNVLHKGYSTEDFLTKMGLKRSKSC